MNYSALERALLEHKGTFLCSGISDESGKKSVTFRHEVMAPAGVEGIPDVGDLRDFYAVFGGIVFYHDEKSGDAARYIAPIEVWPELNEDFSGWLEGLDESEREEYVPEWVETALVVGEEPHSGNYVLIPVAGEEAGAVYHFEHDGFEFNRHAGSLLEYASKLLDLDGAALTYIATHMRFVESDGDQWWIEELRDNRGNIAVTES